MKRVYFVRHGQSTSNVEQIVQGLDDPLSPQGELQAEQIATRAAGLPVTAILSSDALRAHQTAEAISAAIKLPVTHSEVFREIRRPTSLVGVSRATDQYKQFLETERAHMGEPGWRFEDEENYDDIKARADAALRMIEEHPAQDLLVVTHGHFLRFLTSYVLHERTLTPEMWNRLALTILTVNTGVTVYVHDGTRWQLLTWNDFAHFAEGDK